MIGQYIYEYIAKSVDSINADNADDVVENLHAKKVIKMVNNMTTRCLFRCTPASKKLFYILLIDFWGNWIRNA